MDSIKELYKKFYTDIQFDRSLLFKTIQKEFHIKTVLYPGSSIHITSSFFFPHVVYIDSSRLARDFFARKTEVTEFINSHKEYKQTAYFQFLAQDYTDNLSLRENNYDLLISLYSGDIPLACKKYLKIGGLLLTNNYSTGLTGVLEDNEFLLTAVMVFKGNYYQVIKDNLDQYHTVPAEKQVKAKKEHKLAGFEFIKHEYSYLFKKVRLSN